MVFLMIWLVLALSVAKAGVCPEDPSIQIQHRESGKWTSIYLAPGGANEATISMQLRLDNMRSWNSDFFTCDLSHRTDPTRPFEIVRLEVIDPAKAYHYHYDYHFRIGNLGGNPYLNFVYQLPFRQGEVHKINQGYFGTFSHQRGTDDQYAIDFDMPQGTIVCAARAGRVVGVRMDSTVGGPDPSFRSCDNHIVLKHDDGSYAEYVHLAPNGSLVRVGQNVTVGQPIGFSGRTGFSAGPHLHFSVYVPIDGLHIKSVPMRFESSEGIVEELIQGNYYQKSPTNASIRERNNAPTSGPDMEKLLDQVKF
jgi:murein DD-endopeptidase MepM/ murein hydrolase activator NlpD